MGNNSNVQGPKWPNFLLLGAAKAGTTALYSYLRQHPDVYMPENKEPGFFSMYGEEFSLPSSDKTSTEYRLSEDLYQRVLRHAIVDPDQYRELFSGAKPGQAIGEATTSNLYFPKAPENIQRFVPDARLIAILRHPVERAFSGYLHGVRVGREQRSFKEALSREPIDSENIWWGSGDYYVRPGFYSKQLLRYFDRFDRNQIKIYLYDDLVDNPEALARDLFGFLGIDETYQLDMSQKHNVSATASGLSGSVFRAIHKAATTSTPLRALTDAVKQSIPKHWRKRLSHTHRSVRLQERMRDAESASTTEWVGDRGSGFRKPRLNPEDRQWLSEIYREDILKLQELLQRDLSAWLQEGNVSEFKSA